MERLSDNAADILNDLHTERLNYDSEYIPLANAINSLAAYEDTGVEPEEITTAIDSAAKLIATMRNNKKAALWLKKYGPAEAGDTP